MTKIWLFSSYLFQGNPKYLFQYISRYRKDIKSYWIAENEKQKSDITKLGLNSYTKKENKAYELYKVANVYIVENYREWIPYELNKNIVIVNLWHGVGIKHIELGIEDNYYLSKNIASKWIRHNRLYKHNTLFLTTSKFMEKHFIEELNLNEKNIIRGGYPRNILCNDPEFATFNIEEELGVTPSKYKKTILFAPTYCEKNEHSIFNDLLKIADSLKEIAETNNFLIILKSHPLEQSSKNIKSLMEQLRDSKHILFWPNNLDIYEIFQHIDTAILDYSSIIYDLLSTGTSEVIRFIPDFNEHIVTTRLKFDYLENTVGSIALCNEELLQQIQSDCNIISREKLQNKFFGYHKNQNCSHLEIDKLIKQINSYNITPHKSKTLYSFDIFDTLLERKYITPESIFFATKERIKQDHINLPKDFIENYVDIRKNAELDIRESYKRTNIERKTNKNEITINDIFELISSVYQLSKTQKEIIIALEKELEIAHSIPIEKNIERALELSKKENDVILISDMYLDKSTISKMLVKANPLLANLPIYLSSEIGYQKTNGSLYKYIFRNIDYDYAKWIHFGDNYHADHEMAREYSIRPIHHKKNEFSIFESTYIEHKKSLNSIKIASLWNYKKKELLDKTNFSFKEEEYYAYVYVAPLLVPYVAWLVNDAISRKYKTIYFISRDGILLKKIADYIIKEKELCIKTKLIYGSRKAWRLAGQIDGIDDFLFTRLGLFNNEISNFKELVKNSYLKEEKLLEMIPKLNKYKHTDILSNVDLQIIRKILSDSNKYREFLKYQAKKERSLARIYLINNIDYTESFCFAEYSARGYTQDCFDRILKSTHKHTSSTDFYYIKSYYSSCGDSIRHRYLTSKNYFTFVEPIFTTSPIKSVTGYINKNETIVPYIRKNKNQIYKYIKKGVLDFTKDYIEENLIDNHYFGRELTNYIAEYHIQNPADYFIYKVYSKINNQSRDDDSFHLTISPNFTIDDITNNDIDSLKKLTNNMRLSLLKSSTEVKKLFFKKFDVKIQPNEVDKIKNKFPETDLNKIANKIAMGTLIATKEIKVYSSITLTSESTTIYSYFPGDIIKIIEIIWDPNGIPFILTINGFIEIKLENFK